MSFESDEAFKKFEETFGKTCRHYILKDGVPTPATLKEWSDWIESQPDRVVKEDVVAEDVRVVTVFLPLVYLDPQPDGSIKKYFYGTCVLGGRMNHHELRATSREQAEDNHAFVLGLAKKVAEGGDPPKCCQDDKCS